MKIYFVSVAICIAMIFSGCGSKQEKKEATNNNNDKTEKTDEKTGKTEESKNNGSEDKTEEAQQEKAVVIAKSGLSLRTEPNGKSKLVKLLPTNTIVEVLEKGEIATLNGRKAAWYKVQFGKDKGYAFGGFLQMGNKVKSTNQANAETAGAGAENTNFADVLQKGLVTAESGLTLRKEASAKAASVTVIPKNQEVGVLEFTEISEEIKGMHGVWCKVRYGKKEGYLFSAYIIFSTATITAKSGLTLRKGVGKDSEKITVIQSGKVVYLLPPVFNEAGEVVTDSTYTDEEGNIWYFVRYGRFEGWALGLYLGIEGRC